jgi:hypothetical protein
MANYRIKSLSSRWEEKWDDFIKEANNGTVFHKLKFLEYHKNKFKSNEHHLIFLKGESLFGIMPNAVFNESGISVARSPYGASYGGVITKEVLSYGVSKKLVNLLINHLTENKIDRCIVTPPIMVCSRFYSDTFEFALLEEGFKIISADISNVVPINDTKKESKIFTSRSRNMVRKAQKCNVETVLRSNIEDFWIPLEKTFSKLGKKTTHTLEEWKWLCYKIPDNVWCDVAYIDEKPVAGIGHLKINSIVDSSFYLCSDPDYQNTQALSLLIYDSILNSQKCGFKYFDFGTSSSDQIGNENLFQFKESFGAVGCFRKTFLWENTVG